MNENEHLFSQVDGIMEGASEKVLKEQAEEVMRFWFGMFDSIEKVEHYLHELHGYDVGVGPFLQQLSASLASPLSLTTDHYFCFLRGIFVALLYGDKVWDLTALQGMKDGFERATQQGS